MKKQELYKIIDGTIHPTCRAIMESKGDAYSGQEDKLGNFKRCAELAGVSVEKAWFIYFCKHFDALSAYVRGEYCDSEPIYGRIYDMINYLELLVGILIDKGVKK